MQETPRSGSVFDKLRVTAGWVGSRAGVDTVEKRKIPAQPPPGIEPPTPIVQPISLYQE